MHWIRGGAGWQIVAWAGTFATSLGLAVACGGGGSGFSCSTDGDCELAGVAGVCVSDTTQCAYPDDRCDSGFSYPAGAGAELGGACADGTFDVGTSTGSVSASVSTMSPPATTNVDGDTTVGPPDGTTTGGIVGSSTGPGTTGGTTDASTSGDPTTGEGSSTGPSPPMCPADASEPNDTLFDATDLLIPRGDCVGMESGVLDPRDDEDWFFVSEDPCWLDGATIEVMPAGDLEVCVVFEGCLGGGSVVCPVGTTAAPGNAEGCCDDNGFSVAANCRSGAVYVLAHQGAQACVEYTFGISSMP